MYRAEPGSDSARALEELRSLSRKAGLRIANSVGNVPNAVDAVADDPKHDEDYRRQP
jgi:hypothetical protein